MKKKKLSKKVLAILLSFVMFATALPFGMMEVVAAGNYDPAPKFSEDAITEGARAWLDDDGNVHVTYPAAQAEPTYKGEELSIAFYILELVDMGSKNSSHTNVVLDTIKVAGTSGIFPAADIGTIDLENKRYSVTVTAVDTENWFSQPLYTTVTEVPVAEIDASRFANFSTSPTAVREIMTFERGSDDGRVTAGSQLLYMGVAQEAGTTDLSDGVGDTSALRFIMYNQPTATQAFDTSYSRQTWDFKGAEEIWYWMDLSEVELTGLAFRLKTNEKMWLEWIDDDETLDTEQNAGSIVYSTRGTAKSGYTGEAPYVYVQREDAGWDKVMLNANGTLDIGYFEGYVRVPLKFMCSETDSYIDISNQDLAAGHDYKSGINNSVQDSDVQNWLRSMTFGRIMVDPAGTCITDALLIHRRGLRSSSGFLNAGDRHLYLFNADGITHLKQSYTNGNPAVDYSKAGYMLAVPLDESRAKTTVTTGNVSTDRAYIANGTVQNRAGGLKAIEDIYNAGFSIEGCSADSLQNSFFVDNIFFYRTDGGQYTENTLDGNANTGDPMSTYYDEEVEISRIIFEEIDKYISDPDWADYRELEYILELVDGYRKLYTSQGKDTAFLNLTRSPDTSGLAGMATKLNSQDTWEKAWLAYEACVAEGTIDATKADVNDIFVSNANKNNLVPSIVKTLEKLPPPDSVTSVSEALRKEIVKLWQAYSLLNLGQLEMLGKIEEETLLKYFTLVENLEELDGDEFVVGQQLADFPYIVYNDFESRELGEKGWQLEDNKNAYTTDVAGGTSDLANDWRHLKGLVTYTYNGEWDAPGIEGKLNITDKDLLGYVTTDGDKTHEAMDGKAHYNASWATVTDNGYMHSNAATMHVDSSFTANNNDGVFHTITFARHGKDSANWTEFQANNTGLDNLGALSTENASGTQAIGLSLVLYVDFTEISNFYFTANVYTKESDGTPVKARPNMGIALNDAAKIDNWKYFILHPETGEWVINHTTSQWCFTSTKTDESWGDQLSLDNYQGYIMIPLYHIKVPQSALSEPKLDGNATWLNNIYAIQFCVGGANGNSLDGKSFTIDNVGFTYDPAGYATHDWSSYAEVFGAKSLPAFEFEEAVDAIDPYDETTIDAAVLEAEALYAALPEYQQGVVTEAYKTLLMYKDYSNAHSTIPQPDVASDALAEWIANNLTTDATEASVTGDNDLTHPGFVIENGEVVPNYGAYGLTADLATQIKEFYDNSYIYYTVAEKQAVKDLGFLNAYNAAMRCKKSLEDIKTDSLNFLPLLTELYERKTDADGNTIGNFVSIAERDKVETFKGTNYDPLQYYSKTSIDDGSIYPQLMNTSRGFTYFLNNTREFVVDGENIQGGILGLRDKMQRIYDMANDHITNKTLFTDAELQSVRDIVQEYNALLPAYYNVEELYELEQAIVNLFPVYQTNMGESTLMLSAENLSKSTVYTIEYSEYLDITDPYTDTFYVKVISQNGCMTNDYGDAVNYDVTLASNEHNSYTVKAGDLAGLAEANWVATYPVTNNYSTPDGTQQKFTMTAGVSSPQTGLHGMVTDVLTLQFCHPDGTVLEEQIVQVFYSMGDTYTVTIPANFPVEWGYEDGTKVSYTANTEMNAASSISVKVSSDGTGEMVSVIDPNLKLDYTTANFDVETTFNGMVTNGTQDPAPEVTVSGWDDVPVGEYKTILTYTVVYDAGSDDGTT